MNVCWKGGKQVKHQVEGTSGTGWLKSMSPPERER